MNTFTLFTHRRDWQTRRLTLQCGSGSTTQSSSGWSIGTFVSKILAWYDSLNDFCSVYSNLGLGFASGCIIIIVEIIYAKLKRSSRNLQGGGIILLLMTLSAILTTVTVLMIKAYHYPLYYLIQKVQYYNPIVDYQFKTGRYERFHFNSSILYFFAIEVHTGKYCQAHIQVLSPKFRS